MKQEKEAQEKAEALRRETAAKLEKTKVIILRNEIFRAIRELSQGAFASASRILNGPENELQKKLDEYLVDHQRLSLDQKARSPHLTLVAKLGENAWRLDQTLHDPEDHDDWSLVVEGQIEMVDGVMKAVLVFVSLGGR